MDRDKLLQALQNAHNAGDTASAQRIAQMIQAMPAADAAPSGPVVSPAMGGSGLTPQQQLDEGLIPSGAPSMPAPAPLPLIDTSQIGQPQPMRTDGGPVADIARAGLSGLARGATELIALPDTLGDLVGRGVNAGARRLGFDVGEFQPSPIGSAIRGAASRLTSGATEYQPQTTAGEYAQTVGEFTGGGAGARVGTVAGLLSEGAGQLTEGTAAEPFARAGAGILGSVLATRRGLPFSGDDEAARMANTLQQSGVRNITAGQARQSQPIMRAEGRLSPAGAQLDDFTAATMRQIGSNKPIATPENLRAVERSIVQQMDDAISGVAIAPNQSHAQAATRIAADYVERVPAGSLTPRVRGIGSEIAAAARQVRPVALDRIKEWRSDIGRLTVSPDAATREAAHGMRRILDDMTDTALTQAGRADDIQALAQAREAYRNFIAVRDAASRAGAEGGRLSPTQLNQSVIRSQGREAYATGRTTPFADFTRAGAATLRPAPATNPGGARTISESLPLAGGALLGGGALQAGADPLTAGLLAGGGILAPTIGQSAMRSAPIQGLLSNPATVLGQAVRTAPGLLAQ